MDNYPKIIPVTPSYLELKYRQASLSILVVLCHYPRALEDDLPSRIVKQVQTKFCGASTGLGNKNLYEGFQYLKVNFLVPGMKCKEK